MMNELNKRSDELSKVELHMGVLMLPDTALFLSDFLF